MREEILNQTAIDIENCQLNLGTDFAYNIIHTGTYNL